MPTFIQWSAFVNIKLIKCLGGQITQIHPKSHLTRPRNRIGAVLAASCPDRPPLTKRQECEPRKSPIETSSARPTCPLIIKVRKIPSPTLAERWLSTIVFHACRIEKRSVSATSSQTTAAALAIKVKFVPSSFGISRPPSTTVTVPWGRVASTSSFSTFHPFRRHTCLLQPIKMAYGASAAAGTTRVNARLSRPIFLLSSARISRWQIVFAPNGGLRIQNRLAGSRS